MINFSKSFTTVVIFTMLLLPNYIIAQGKTCAQATPFCTSVGVPFTYPNVHDGSTAPGVSTATNPAVSPFYGCICPSSSGLKNPNWFFVKSSAIGAMTYSISQSNGDVDFVAWGPFTSTTNICNQLTGTCTSNCSVSHPSCSGGIMDCSFSAAATEAMTLNSTAPGQYFMIMITNYQGGSGNITITQTSGNPSDCSITCPPSNFTMVATTAAAPNTVIPYGSTVNCSQPFFIDPPDLTPAGASYNPYTDQLTPCLGINFNPYTTNLDNRGSVTIFENGTATGTLCPTCTQSLGSGGTTAGTNLTWYTGYNDPTLSHSFQFCKTTTAGAVGPTTVSIRNCWTNTIVLAGSSTWNETAGSASCFSLSVPAGVAIGTAVYSISPASGYAGLYDSNQGWAYIDPSYIPSGTTYTVTYTFNNGVCGDLHGYYVFSVPSTPTVNPISSQTVCSGNSVSAINFVTNPSGGSINWTNNNSAVGTATAGTTNISGYTAPTVTATTIGIYTVTATQSGCNSAAQNFSITINPKPTASISPSGTLTCSSPTIALTGSGGGTYAWTGPGITSGSATATPSVNTPGTYSLVVTSTAGCASTVTTVTVPQNITAPATTAGTTGSITCTTNTINLTSSLAGMNYTWTAPAGSSISSGTNSQNAVGQGAGTYTVKVVNATNGCSVQATVAANVNTTTPVSTAGTTGTITCITNTINLTSSLAGMNYTWTAPAGSSISSGINSQNAVGQGVGTYTVKVVNATNGCSVQATTAANVNTTTPTSIAGTSGSITCATNTINLTSSLAGMNYTWTAPGGSSIVSGTNSQNAIGQGLGTYTVKVSNSINGCTYTTSIAAVQNTTTPTSVNAGPTKTLVCGVSTVTLTGSATPGTATANWLGGVTSPNNFTTTTGSAGVYTLQAIEPTTGCFITSTVQVLSSLGAPTVTNNPVTFSITCTNSVVPIGVTVTSTASVTYQWPSSGISGPTNGATASATLAGVYTATVTNIGNGCSVYPSITVTSDLSAPSASIAPASTITCNTTSITLNASPVGSSYTYTWTGSSPIVSGGSTQNPVVNMSGTYSVAITNTVNGCVGNANITVSSNTTAPVVNIAAPSVTTTCANPTIAIAATATPSTGVTYSWTAPSTGSLNNNTISNPIASGYGVFTVVATNTANGCSSSATQNTVEVIADSGIPSTTLSATSLSITCSNPTPSVSITTTTPPVSYNWSPTSGIVPGTETTANPSFNAAGSYSAIVTSNVSGCATSITSNVVDVVLDNTPPVSTLTSGVNNGTITCLNLSVSVTPTVTPASNVTYTWSPATGISSSVNQANATFTAAGVYTLVITNTVTGCVSSSTASANTFTVIADNTPPTFTLGTAPSVTTTCALPNATLSATSNADPNSVYTWITPTSATLTGNPLINSTPGIYTVAVTNTVNGCNSSSVSQNTLEVVQGIGIPSTTLSATSVSITCSNPTPSVSITTTTSPVSYSWLPTSGIVPGTETTATPSFTAPGSYSAVVTNTTSGCSTTASGNVITVTLNNTVPVLFPFVGATNSGTINCISSSVVASPVINPNSDLTYTWSPTGAGLATPVNQASATFTAAGIYTLAVTNTLTGCVSVIDAASTFTVIDDKILPTPSIITVSTNTIIGCGAGNATVTLDGSASSSSHPSPVFTWLPPNTTGATLPVTTSGTYTLVVTDAVNGCTATTQYFVDGNTTPPQNVSAGSNANIACGSSTIALNGLTTSTNVSFSWVGPTGTSIISGANTANPIVGETGIYTLTVTDNLTGCQSTSTVTVSQANVTAAFTADPTTGTSPLSVNFTDASNGANSWNWNFGDSNTSSAQNPNNVYTTGTYTVTLTASSGSCTSTATLVIVVEDGLSLEVPNVFTPNNDGKNDVFTIKSTGVKEISLQIFNRWGEKLYEFTGAKASWDGEVPNGSKAPDATYFYFVKATGFDGNEIEKHGTVTLFR